MNAEKDLIPIQKVNNKIKEVFLLLFYISLDERRRRIVLCLKFSPETEKNSISSIYHYLKAKSSTMVC